MKRENIIDALLGVAIGDALGVPFEFSSREKMQLKPAKDMVGYGTYFQPEGTWSDDSSLTFCLAESLTSGYNLKDMAEKFIKWKQESYWTARGNLFDIGKTTSDAIARLRFILKKNDVNELYNQKNLGTEDENGNGSLMRILPLVFYIKDFPLNKQFEIIWEVSALTHRHIRAAMSCMIYIKMTEKLLQGENKLSAYQETRNDINNFWNEISFPENEKKVFEKIIQKNICETNIEDLKTGGYVIESLESSFWFFLKNENYKDTVLSIINLGHDTDTSAAI
jgi:ADP-ribosyl-[dinitrogen reductase] hydrolase